MAARIAGPDPAAREVIPMLERLQKILARAGIASRRHAEQLIRSGQVRVNGRIVTQLGTKADPERDRIEAAGRRVPPAKEKCYVLLHKPAHVVTTLADPEGRKTLRHFLSGMPVRVFPVGRLEYDSAGLVLLTNDGEFASRILKAAARLPQTYWIKVKGRLEAAELAQVSARARARLRPLELRRSRENASANPWYEVTLAGARRDLLRRALWDLGHPVEKMKRVRLGSLELKDLPEGRFRYLEQEEVAGLERSLRRALNAPVRSVG